MRDGFAIDKLGSDARDGPQRVWLVRKQLKVQMMNVSCLRSDTHVSSACSSAAFATPKIKKAKHFDFRSSHHECLAPTRAPHEAGGAPRVTLFDMPLACMLVELGKIAD